MSGSELRAVRGDPCCRRGWESWPGSAGPACRRSGQGTKVIDVRQINFTCNLTFASENSSQYVKITAILNVDKIYGKDDIIRQTWRSPVFSLSRHSCNGIQTGGGSNWQRSIKMFMVKAWQIGGHKSWMMWRGVQNYNIVLSVHFQCCLRTTKIPKMVYNRCARCNVCLFHT